MNYLNNWDENNRKKFLNASLHLSQNRDICLDFSLPEFTREELDSHRDLEAGQKVTPKKKKKRCGPS